VTSQATSFFPDLKTDIITYKLIVYSVLVLVITAFWSLGHASVGFPWFYPTLHLLSIHFQSNMHASYSHLTSLFGCWKKQEGGKEEKEGGREEKSSLQVKQINKQNQIILLS